MQYLEILAGYQMVDLPVFDHFNSSDAPDSRPAAVVPRAERDGTVLVVAVTGFILVSLLIAGARLRTRPK
jgi:hypothetical protein